MNSPQSSKDPQASPVDNLARRIALEHDAQIVDIAVVGGIVLPTPQGPEPRPARQQIRRAAKMLSEIAAPGEIGGPRKTHAQTELHRPNLRVDASCPCTTVTPTSPAVTRGQQKYSMETISDARRSRSQGQAFNPIEICCIL